MTLIDALREQGGIHGFLTKKQRMKMNTPLRNYLRPLMEESMRRETEEWESRLQGGMQSQLQPQPGNALQQQLLRGGEEDEPNPYGFA